MTPPTRTRAPAAGRVSRWVTGALLVCLGCVVPPAMAGSGAAGAPRLVLVLVVPAGVTASSSLFDDLRDMLRSANAWLQREGARQVRLRRDAAGAVRVETLALEQGEAELLGLGDGLVAHLSAALGRAYADSRDVVMYAYAGRVALRSTTHCGRRLGRHAGLFLANAGCVRHAFSSRDGQGWDKIFLHELFHLLGAVPACAPNADGGRHVSDSRSDLMHRNGGGARPRLDVNRDDYFAHRQPACADVADNPLLE